MQDDLSTSVTCTNPNLRCSLRVVGSPGGITTVGLAFDQKAISAAPTLELASQPGTADHATIAVRGAGFTPGAPVEVAQCEVTTGSDGCPTSVHVTADASGLVHTTLDVTRLVGGVVDCAWSPCVVHAAETDSWRVARATVRFQPDPSRPTLSLRGDVVPEGSTTTYAHPRASLDRVVDHPVTFSWTAVSLGAEGRTTIPAGADHVDLSVPVQGNSDDGPNLTVELRLTAVGGAQTGPVGRIAQIWIVDDDRPPEVSIGPALVSEHTAYASVPVRVTQPYHRIIEVAYRVTGRSATDGKDFVGGTGVVSLMDGDDGTTIDIPILNDSVREGPERFTVEITEVRGATVGSTRANVWIGDDD
jgi:hypothetical protein